MSNRLRYSIKKKRQNTKKLNLPDADKVVTVSSKERLSIGAPCKGQALRRIGPGAARHLRREFDIDFVQPRRL